MKLRTKRWLDAGSALVIAMVFALAATMTWLARERELAASRTELANMATALELYVQGTVVAIDQSLISAGYALGLLPSQRRTSFADGSRVLADVQARLGLPVTMRVLNRDGEVRYSADGRTFAGNSRDREFFLVHQARPDAGLYVSELIVSRISGRENVAFSRRLDDADGNFAGVVIVGAPLEVFERDFARFGTGRGSALTLGDDAGRLYAHRPPRPDLVGKTVLPADSPSLKLLRGGAEGGIVLSRSPLDGLMRLTAFRRVGSTRLVVAVSSALDEQLAAWRMQALVVAIVVLVLGSGSLLLFTLLTRDLVRKTRLTDELRQAVDALQQSVRVEHTASAAKTAFLSSMSHELMTPLNGIYGAVQLWELGERDPGRRHLAQLARTSTERLTGALRDALAYANATASPGQAGLAALDLDEVLRDVPEMFAAQPGSAGCRLVAVPAPRPGGRTVHGDAASLRDALRRMVGVAVRVARSKAAATTGAAGEADGAVGVRVDAKPQGEGFVVAVETALAAGAGPALAAALRPFADSGATETNGLHDAGLGLEVARLLALRTGALLSVTTRDDRLAITLAVPG